MQVYQQEGYGPFVSSSLENPKVCYGLFLFFFVSLGYFLDATATACPNIPSLSLGFGIERRQ